MLSNLATPLLLYPTFLDKTNFPRLLTPRARYPQDLSTNPHTVSTLKFAWLSCGVPLLWAPDTRLLAPFPPWGSIKRIFPGYRPLAGQRRQQYPQLTLDLVPSLKFDFRVGLPGVRTMFSNLATPLVLYPSFSIKRIFPEYRPRGPGTPRTPLQSPHGPNSEVCLALPWRTAARGTRHTSAGPISPLGLDKTNFPRVQAPSGAKGATIPTTRTRSRL